MLLFEIDGFSPRYRKDVPGTRENFGKVIRMYRRSIIFSFLFHLFFTRSFNNHDNRLLLFHLLCKFSISLSLSLCIILTFEKRVFKESITKPKLIPRFYCYLSLYNFNILLRKRIFKEFLNLSLELEKILIAIIIISESLEGVVHQFVT